MNTNLIDFQSLNEKEKANIIAKLWVFSEYWELYLSHNARKILCKYFWNWYNIYYYSKIIVYVLGFFFVISLLYNLILFFQNKDLFIFSWTNMDYSIFSFYWFILILLIAFSFITKFFDNKFMKKIEKIINENIQNKSLIRVSDDYKTIWFYHTLNNKIATLKANIKKVEKEETINYENHISIENELDFYKDVEEYNKKNFKRLFFWFIIVCLTGLLFILIPKYVTILKPFYNAWLSLLQSIRVSNKSLEVKKIVLQTALEKQEELKKSMELKQKYTLLQHYWKTCWFDEEKINNTSLQDLEEECAKALLKEGLKDINVKVRNQEIYQAKTIKEALEVIQELKDL